METRIKPFLRIFAGIILLANFLFAMPAHAACVNPAGNPADVRYSREFRTVYYCDGASWVAPLPYTYTADGAGFNGTNTNLTMSGALSGVSVGKQTVGLFWFRRAGGTGVRQDIFDLYKSTTQTYSIYFDTANKIHIAIANNTGTAEVDVNGSTVITDTNWHDVMFSIDVTQSCTSGSNNNAGCQIYLDNAAQTITINGGHFTNTNLGFVPSTTPNTSIGGTPTGANLFNGALADMAITFNAPADLRVAAARAVVYNPATGDPVYIGSSTSAAAIFLSGIYSAWQTNLGASGGVFTVHGALTDGGDVENSANPATIAMLQHIAISTSAWTLTFPSTTTIGSLLVVCPTSWGFTETGYGATDTAGNTFTTVVGPTVNTSIDGAGTPATSACLSAINTKAQASDVVTITDTPSNAPGEIFMAEFSGIASATPDTAHAAQGTSVNPSSGTAATSNANDLIFGLSLVKNSVTQGSGFNLVDNASGDVSEYQIASATGSYAATFTGSSQPYIAQMIAFRGLSNARCAGPVGIAGDMLYNSASHVPQFCNGASWTPMGPVPGTGGSNCASPAGAEGAMIYNSDKGFLQYCDGAHWIAMGTGYNGPQTGLVGWWKMDDGSGASAADATGNGHTGTLLNSPTWTTAGQANGALTLNGSTQYVSIPDAAALRLSGSWTLSTWVKLSALPSAGNDFYLVSKRVPSTDANYALLVDYNGVETEGAPAWMIGFQDSSGNVYDTYYAPPTAIVTGAWYQVAAVYSASAQTLTLYMNGSQVATNAVAGAPTSVSGEPLTIGSDVSYPAYMAGSIDDVRVYNRALTATEVMDLYQATGGQ